MNLIFILLCLTLKRHDENLEARLAIVLGKKAVSKVEMLMICLEMNRVGRLTVIKESARFFVFAVR